MAGETLEAKVVRFEGNEQRFNTLVNGGPDDTWSSTGGTELPSVQKFFADTEALYDNAVLVASYAEMESKLPTIPEGSVVEVQKDETTGYSRTRYKVGGGYAVFLVNMDRWLEFVKRTSLIYQDYAAAAADAVTLPNGQEVVIPSTGKRFSVEGGLLSNAALLPTLDLGRFGLKGFPQDDNSAFQAAYSAAVALGGAKIVIPPGKYAGQIVLNSRVYWEGAGRGATVITQLNGQNRDIAYTWNFESLTGVGPLAAAPVDFGVTKLSIDGNYLEDYASSSIGGDTTVNNTVGYGVKIFGSKYTIDIELNNCPQVGFYSEAVDYTGYGFEQSSHINIDGRVFGKDGFIYRGPADVNINHLILGCPGWLETQAKRQSTIVMSDIYPTEPVCVMVSDEVSPYHGHHEFGFMHLYGNLSGWAYRGANTGRLKGNHMVCENARGGAWFPSRVWGGIAMLECHNNQREPSELAGTLPPLPDIRNQSQQGFAFNAVVRPSATQASTKLALEDSSRSNIVTLNYFTAGGSALPDAYVANIKGRASDYRINLTNTSQDAVIVESVSSKISVVARGVTGGSVVRRVAGTTSGNLGNDISVVADACDSGIHLDGLVTTEKLAVTGSFNSGGLPFSASGSAPDMVGRAVSVDVSTRTGVITKCSRDVGRVNLDNTVTTEQTIAVDHVYFQTPDPAQVSYSIYDPAPTYASGLEYLRLQSISASQLTFVYKLKSVGTGGPLVLCWRIQ